MSDDCSKELTHPLEMKVMGDFPLEAASSPVKHVDGNGRQLTEEDQKQRWEYFQEKQEIGPGLSDSDCKLQKNGKELGTATQKKSVDILATTGTQPSEAPSSASKSVQALDQNRNQSTKPPCEGSVFSLNSDDSSFVISTVSNDNGLSSTAQSPKFSSAFPLSSKVSGDVSKSALPLSSKVSEELSKLSVIGSEVTAKPESTSCCHGDFISPTTTKQEAAYAPNRLLPDRDEESQFGAEVDQKPTQTKTPQSLRNGFLPLSSRGEGTLVISEDDQDDEICDILILFHENDETHLSRFQGICDKYGWTTRTKDDFPLGELGFQQLEEELDKCVLVVSLFSANFLENGLSSHEHHTALMKSIRDRSKNFIPIVCEKNLKLPSYIQTMTVGNLDKPSFEKQFKSTVSSAKKKHESRTPSLPLNNFDTNRGVRPCNQQQGLARSNNARGSAPCVFRRLQGDLSPGPYAQKFFTDEPFRELCLVLDLADSLGTPYWHKLAEYIGLMQQDIIWLQQQGRCAANILEVYFCRRMEEAPAVVLSRLINILEKELNHLQAAGIVRDELSRVSPCPL